MKSISNSMICNTGVKKTTYFPTIYKISLVFQFYIDSVELATSFLSHQKLAFLMASCLTPGHPNLTKNKQLIVDMITFVLELYYN